jgi:hypothetical protein
MSLRTPEKIRNFQIKLYRKAKADLEPVQPTPAWTELPNDMR